MGVPEKIARQGFIKMTPTEREDYEIAKEASTAG
jgi:hypothetical protein